MIAGSGTGDGVWFYGGSQFFQCFHVLQSKQIVWIFQQFCGNGICFAGFCYGKRKGLWIGISLPQIFLDRSLEAFRFIEQKVGGIGKIGQVAAFTAKGQKVYTGEGVKKCHRARGKQLRTGSGKTYR